MGKAAGLAVPESGVVGAVGRTLGGKVANAGVFLGGLLGAGAGTGALVMGFGVGLPWASRWGTQSG